MTLSLTNKFKQMKQLKIILLLLLMGGFAKAQQLTLQTLSAAGVSSSNSGVLLEYSLGSLSVTSISTPTFTYTQGFLQPNAGTTTTPPPINDVVLSTGSTLDNAGTTFINGGVMLEFTMGEMASITLNSSSHKLTQGILQPYKTCTPLLVLTAGSKINGTYEARDEIRLEGNFNINAGTILHLKAPKVTVVNQLQIHQQAQVFVSNTGCQ
jgi:hypothetical protein